MIDFGRVAWIFPSRWESVTDPLDRLPNRHKGTAIKVGNQLPILLIDFEVLSTVPLSGWESVTDPLDRLHEGGGPFRFELGISYRSS